MLLSSSFTLLLTGFRVFQSQNVCYSLCLIIQRMIIDYVKNSALHPPKIARVLQP